MTKNLVSGPSLARFGPNLVTKNVFGEFYHYLMFDIDASYYPMQFQGKIKTQTWENGKKPIFRPDFVSFGTFGPKTFFPGFYLY